MGKWCLHCSDAFKIRIDGTDLICMGTPWGGAVRLRGQSGSLFQAAAPFTGAWSHMGQSGIIFKFISCCQRFFASSIPWPLSSSVVNQTRPSKWHFVLVLSLLSLWLPLQAVQCLLVMMSQDPREGAAAQRYKLSLVPASRGHCCSINFSESLFRDLVQLFSLMFHRLLIYLDNLLHLQMLFWVRTENFWDFRTQIATSLSPRCWKQRAFCDASFQPGMHCSWKRCWLASVLQRLCVLHKWSAGGIEI